MPARGESKGLGLFLPRGGHQAGEEGKGSHLRSREGRCPGSRLRRMAVAKHRASAPAVIAMAVAVVFKHSKTTLLGIALKMGCRGSQMLQGALWPVN